jgi:hypothetical protein
VATPARCGGTALLVGATAVLRGETAVPRGEGVVLLGAAAVPEGVVLRGETADPDRDPLEPRGETELPRGAAAAGALGLAGETPEVTGGVARRETVPAEVPFRGDAEPAVAGGATDRPGVRSDTGSVRPGAALEAETPPRDTTPACTGSVLARPLPSSVRKLTSSPSCLVGVVEVAPRAGT